MTIITKLLSKTFKRISVRKSISRTLRENRQDLTQKEK